MPLLSIVVPVKNGKHFLQKCIDSVLAQTVKDFELIVLTDVTTNDDGTLDYLRLLQVDNLKIVESKERLGIQENWARILSVPKSEFFTILGYDDVLYPNYLETIFELIRKHPKATLFQTHFDFINENGEKFKSAPPMEHVVSGSTYLTHVLRSDYPVIATGFVIRSSDFEKVGGMPVHYPNLLYADFELWLRLTFLGYQAISPKTCFGFRIHQSTTKVSSTKTTLNGFKNLVDYLSLLRKTPEYDAIIKKEAAHFLKFHCNGIAYRVIRNKKREEGITVNSVIQAFEDFAVQLGLSFVDFKQVRLIKIAWLIDQFSITRHAYQCMKKIYTKPLIRTLPR